MVRHLFLACVSLLSLFGAQGLKFDIVSIRPQAADHNRFPVKPPANGRFTGTGSVAKLLLMLAYDVQDSLIIGGSIWLATEKWDIEAKCDGVGKYSVAETRGMLQHMLVERFGLRCIGKRCSVRPISYDLSLAWEDAPVGEGGVPDGAGFGELVRPCRLQVGKVMRNRARKCSVFRLDWTASASMLAKVFERVKRVSVALA